MGILGIKQLFKDITAIRATGFVTEKLVEESFKHVQSEGELTRQQVGTTEDNILEQLDDIKRDLALQRELTGDLLKMYGEILSTLVKPYQQTEPNTTSALDQRLFDKEEVEWDEVLLNPFADIVV